jgi:CRP-like cAMP-binding protein
MVSEEVLGGLCFLHDVGDEYLRQIASIAECLEVPAGRTVFREGDATAYIYLVAEGRVALEIQMPVGAVRIETIGAGELLGWTPVLKAGPMTATARTLTPCRLIVLRAPQVLALFEHSPRLGLEFMRRTALALADRLNATRLQLLDVYRQELPVVSDPGGGG